MANTRGGAVLIEVVVALAILALIGVASMSFAAESTRFVANAQKTEQEVQSAGAFLSSVALWPTDDLDRHLGEHRTGAWSLRVNRPEPHLYEVAVADSLTRVVLLETVLYRPDRSGPPNASRR